MSQQSANDAPAPRGIDAQTGHQFIISRGDDDPQLIMIDMFDTDQAKVAAGCIAGRFGGVCTYLGVRTNAFQ